MPDETRDTGIVIVSEGGERETNFPSDPGGQTKFGISKRAHPTVDIHALDLAGAEAIYHTDYAVPVGYAQHTDPLALHLLSAGVNCGVASALSLLARPARTFAAEVEAFDWAWVARYAHLIAPNVARVTSRLRGQPEATVYKAQRDEYAKLLGWLNRVLNVRRDS